MSGTTPETDEVEQKEDFFEEASFEDADEIALKAEILSAFDDEGEEDDVYSEPLESVADHDLISENRGRQHLEQADANNRTPTKPDADGAKDQSQDELGNAEEQKAPEAEPAGESDVAKGESSEGKSSEDAEPPATSEDIRERTVDDLLDGVPDDRKGEVKRRLGDAERLLAPFAAHQAELDRHGQTPEGAINRLIELNTFAQTKPDEYLAWVATQTNPQALEGAAKLLGYKLTRDGDEGEDDMFSDPEIKALREENAQLKAKISGSQPEFGPDTPERQQARTVQQQLQAFVGEVDEAGHLKRPFFGQLRPRISEMAASHRNSTGATVTMDDLQRFYDQAVSEAQAAFGAPPVTPQDTSAAQQAIPLADEIKAKAAAAKKAQRASKTIGSGSQGAPRQPGTRDLDEESTRALIERLAEGKS